MTGVIHPHTVRNRTVRVMFEIQGGSGGASSVQIRLMGRAAPDAPFYVIQEVIGNFETAVGSQVKCGSGGTYALETFAFPEMKAKVQAYNDGNANAAYISDGIELTANPVIGDTLTVQDAYGNSIRLVFHSGDPSVTSGLGIPVLIGAGEEDTVTNIKDAIIAYNALPHPNYKPFHITASAGSTTKKITLTHNIPGSTGNSASISSTGSGFTTGTFSSGTGSDTYGSCWLDDGY